MIYLGEKFILKIWVKGAQNGLKMKLSSFMKNKYVQLVWFFCMELQEHKGWKLIQMILREILYWDFEAKNAPRCVF